MDQLIKNALIPHFRFPGVTAIALMGSLARGDAGPFSDIDLVRFTDSKTPVSATGTHLIEGHFVTVSDVPCKQADKWFTDPEKATLYIKGLQTARPIWDEDDYLKDLQAGAISFVWDAEMQKRANALAGSQMVGWIEEAMKGLEGLRRRDEGRMLNAKHGLTWGLTGVVRIYKGILLTGDNDAYTEVAQGLGAKSEWGRLSRRAFGLETISLPEQIRAGLKLYLLTFEMLADDIRREDRKLIAEAAKRIRTDLAFGQVQLAGGWGAVTKNRAWFDEHFGSGGREASLYGDLFTCPCCGYPTLTEGRGMNDICYLCWWEDDGQDDPHAYEVWGGPNDIYSLAEARRNFVTYGISMKPGDNPLIDARNDREIKRAILEAFDAMPGKSEVEIDELWKKVQEGCDELERKKTKL